MNTDRPSTREQRWVVILNPAADRGRAAAKRKLIQQAFERLGLNFRLLTTERPGHATQLAQEALREAAVVVAAGGDGTVNEVAQGLVGTEATLGIIPIGSGNDYARVLGLPADPAVVVELLPRMRVRQVDVGMIGERYYLNSLGMGIDGQIALDYRRMRLLRGEAGYILATVWEALRFRGVEVEIRGDGWEFHGRILTTAVMNGPYAGGGFYLAPQARLDDGELDVVVIGNYPRLVRLAVLPKTRDGSYLELRRVHAKRARTLRVTSARPLPVHLDGELLPQPLQALEVTLLPGALRVLRPVSEKGGLSEGEG